MTDTPDGLGDAGRKLWLSIAPAAEMASHERVLLEQACRSLDVIAELEAARVGEPVLTTGSKGQDVAHPLLAQIRAERLAFARVLASLRIPDKTGARPQTRAGARGFYAVRGNAS